jgi:hypothetical protein
MFLFKNTKKIKLGGFMIKLLPRKSSILIIVLPILFACALPTKALSEQNKGIVIRTNEQDGQGPIVPNCLNVSSLNKFITYDPFYYRSTNISIFREAIHAGFLAKQDVDNEKNRFVRFKKEFSYALMTQIFGTDGRNPKDPAFCMVFDASESDVSRVVGEVMNSIDLKSIYNNNELMYYTDFIERNNLSRNKWRERYGVDLAILDSDQVAVKVYRGLQISRGNEAYVKAISDGNNETWILKRIFSKLKK